MNGVPRKLELMMRLQRPGSPSCRALQIGSPQRRNSTESQTGSAEPGNSRCLCQARDLTGVFQCRRQRFVYKQRLVRLDDYARLRQMNAPVHAREQNSVHLLAKLLDAINDFHLPLVAQLASESFDTIAALVDIR